MKCMLFEALSMFLRAGQPGGVVGGGVRLNVTSASTDKGTKGKRFSTANENLG